ncbi:hypothetical protein CASFOL_005206 [Castilleja foliolosa]|uniref:C2H2-type domain-containing protein n=1 Tax=Castilleja foliolosa TaxID=1961234 RepID=A0ABD3E2R5_9LAMI
MEPGKYSNSEISSPENDLRPEDTTGIGRSYECTFCKRGFTNAQALGGHMNIHRKDKAYKANKAKLPKNDQERSSKVHHNITSSNENYPNIRYNFFQTDHHLQHQTSYYRPYDYQVYLSNPSFETRRDYESDHVDANLSLRIGSLHDDEEHMNLNNEAKVDLELRLGHERR